MDNSSFILPFLPVEIINLILIRLPVKSILKFRCVSKSWLSLISSIEFIKTHLSNSVNNEDCAHHRLILQFDPPQNNLKDYSLSSLLYDSTADAFELDYPLKKTLKFIEIVGSVNGLICLSIKEQGLFIWNPTLRKSKKLPDPGIDYYNIYGFGYDELHDDYKVLVGDQGWTRGVEVKLYSLNSDSWRSIDDIQRKGPSTEPCVFVNGKLHWGNNNDFHWGIISVDLTDGKWGKVEQPCYKEGNFNPTLGVLQSDLSVFCNYLKIDADMWVMKEYGVKESWTKMFIINLHNDDISEFSPFFCMSNKGEILLYRLDQLS